jgi:hypothetical protein
MDAATIDREFRSCGASSQDRLAMTIDGGRQERARSSDG